MIIIQPNFLNRTADLHFYDKKKTLPIFYRKSLKNSLWVCLNKEKEKKRLLSEFLIIYLPAKSHKYF